MFGLVRSRRIAHSHTVDVPVRLSSSFFVLSGQNITADCDKVRFSNNGI